MKGGGEARSEKLSRLDPDLDHPAGWVWPLLLQGQEGLSVWLQEDARHQQSFVPPGATTDSNRRFSDISAPTREPGEGGARGRTHSANCAERITPANRRCKLAERAA